MPVEEVDVEDIVVSLLDVEFVVADSVLLFNEVCDMYVVELVVTPAGTVSAGVEALEMDTDDSVADVTPDAVI